jgi:hypothetical protein
LTEQLGENMNIEIKIKSEEWLDKNAHKDGNGDYWENKDAMLEWLSTNNEPIRVPHTLAGCWYDYDICALPLIKYAWAIEETPETHPQYYV